MADRVVKVVLAAEVAGYMSAMEAAAQKTRETGTEAEKLAQKREAFNTLGTAGVAFGTAMLAAAGAVAKTGIEYNTLQQTSRAALSTLLGGAEAANAQMDKLDEFARSSPFSKSVFIEAQQQLLGFGMAADKVVPTLDAIQNAVAATGGSNQDIAELTRIIAQLQGGVKLSAETLNQFGVRGIDAAQLIGDAMGKTGAQIREDITSGAIDADTAIQALTDGMSERFGGAAEGVKETFAGATDRVKAAWRDLAASLMEPLVDPSGGGFLVDATNGLADFMRRIEQLPQPVKLALGGISGLAGAASLAAGTFLLAVPRIVAFRTALDTMGTGAQRVGRALGVVGKSAGLAVGLLALAHGAAAAAKAFGQMGEATRSVEETMSLLLDKNFDGIFAGLSEGVGGVYDLKSALDQLLSEDWQTAFDRWGSDLFSFTGLESSTGKAREQFAAIGDALAELVNSGDGDRARQMFDDIAAAAVEQGYSTEQVAGLMPSYMDALRGVSNEQALATDATGDGAAAMGEFGEEAKAAQSNLDALKSSIKDYTTEAYGVQEAQDNLNKVINDSVEALEKFVSEGGSGKEAMRGTSTAAIEMRDTFADIETQARDTAVSLKENGASTEEAMKAYDKGRDQVIGMLEQMGVAPDKARAWADKMYGPTSRVEGMLDDVATAANSIPKEKTTKVFTDKAKAQADLEQVKYRVEHLPDGSIRVVADTSQAQAQITALVANARAQAITIAVNAATSLMNLGSRSSSGKGFADGGLVAHAGGDFYGPGVYRGGANIHKFAEPETIWEAYISGKPDARDRNVGVWMQAGERLGAIDELVKALGASQSGGPMIGRVDIKSGTIDGAIDKLSWAMRKIDRGGRP